MFIKAAHVAPAWVDQIVGAADILAEAGVKGTVADLAATGKLYIVDFTTYVPVIEPAWDITLEAPIGLFFLAPDKLLRPLAIKFTLQNQLVYSPKDPPMDWFLAKVCVCVCVCVCV